MELDPIRIGNFFTIPNPKRIGEWIYKSIHIKKKDGNLKKKFHDLPRYKVIYEYEGAMKKDYDKHLKKGVLEMIKKLKTFL